MKDNNACVVSCPEGKYANKTTNVCEECNGPCPKSRCFEVFQPRNLMKKMLMSESIKNFTGP